MFTRYFLLTGILLLLTTCGGRSVFDEPDTGLLSGVSPDLQATLTAELDRVLIESGRDKAVSMPPREARNRVEDITVTDDGEGGVIVSFAYLNVGDYDLNGLVSVSDLTPIGVGYGVTSASPDWFMRGVADGDNNGLVGIGDITPIGQNFGNAVTGYIIEATMTPEDEESWEEVGSVLFSDGTRTTSSLPKRQQVLIQAQIVDISVDHEISVMPFQDIGSIREFGIPTYGEEITPINSGWGQVGGNAGHTGYSSFGLPATAGNRGVFSGGSGLVLSTPPVQSVSGDWFLGTTDGAVINFNPLLEAMWQTSFAHSISSITVSPSGNDLVVGLKDYIAYLNAETGEILDTQETDGPVYHGMTNLGGLMLNSSYAFGDTLGNGYRISLDPVLGITLDWQVNLGAKVITGRPLILGNALTFLLNGESPGSDEIINADPATGTATVIDTGLDIKDFLKLDSTGALWSLDLHGQYLQRYLEDGSKSTTLLPQAGDSFTAVDPSPDEPKLFVGYRASIGVGKLRIWNITLGEEEAHKQLDEPVEEVFAVPEGVFTMTPGVSAGKITSWGLDLTKHWDADLPGWESITPRISLSYDVTGDGSTVFNAKWGKAIKFDSGGNSQNWGYNIGGAHPVAPLAGEYFQFGAKLGKLPITLDTYNDAGSTVRLGGTLPSLIEPHGEIPILSDIPLVGGLFRTRAGQSRSSSTLIFLTPRIVFSAGREASAAADAGFSLYETDGTLAWDFPLADAQVGAAAFQTDRFLVAATPTGADATLYCLAEEDGELLWDADLPGAAITTPVLDDAGRCAIATDDGTLSCFDPAGQGVWTTGLPVVTSGLMVHGGRLFCCSEATLYVLDMADGVTLHTVSLPGAVDGATPSRTNDGEVVVITADGDVAKVDPGAVTPVASLLAPLGTGCQSQPVCDPAGRIAVATLDGIVHCLDSTGNELWQVDTGYAQRLELSIASNGTIYAAGMNGGTYVISEPD